MGGGNGGAKSRKIVVENVNHPGRTTVVDAEKYQAVRTAMLDVLPTEPPGLTYGELSEALAPRLPEHLFPGGATARWWAKTVQLDLEAKGIVAREPEKPLRWHRVPRP